MTREPDPTGFDAIVAAWRAEGNVPQWPDDPQLDEMTADARTSLDTDVDTDAETDVDTDVDTDTDADTDVDSDAPADPAAADRPDGAAGSRSDPDAPRADPDRTDPPLGAARADPDRADGPFSAARADPSRTDHVDDDVDRRDGRVDGVDPDHPGRGGAEHAEDVADRRGTNGEHGHPVRAGAAADPNVDEHFVPPDPPPLPRMGPPILVGLTLIGLGLVLVTFPGWVGVPQVYGLPLGLVAIAAGLGWLVLRLWPDPDDVPPPLYLDDPDDPDGGAVL